MRKLILIILVFAFSNTFCNNINKAFEALSIFDYFKAKQLFYKSLKKQPCNASFGLATIYYKTDNPFSNIDSAAKYIALAQLQFKDTATYNVFKINKPSIAVLAFAIAQKGFEKYTLSKKYNDYNYYLSHFYFVNDSLKQFVYNLRDEQQFNYYNIFENTDSIQLFIKKYPQSNLNNQALNQFYLYQFTQTTSLTNLNGLKFFLINYKKNPNKAIAETTLFELTKNLHNADSLAAFITNYSSPLTKQNAWKALYSLEVKNYTKHNLEMFLNKYPNYPDKNYVLNEIKLSDKILFKCANKTGLFGFIDTIGDFIIKPTYEHVTNFNEGFAVACIADSCFYINKQGEKLVNLSFDEGEPFIDGIAIIKKDSLYYLINSSGQLVSKGYNDISLKANNLYVCIKNNYSGAINNKGETVIPFVYNKLGDFKNGYAYYFNGENYGLVNTQNNVLAAQWQWISNVDTNLLITVSKNGKYGLMNLSEQLLLNVDFNKITHCLGFVYLVVKNNSYAFYNSNDKCFISSFNSIYKVSDIKNYTNGTYFKLINDEDEVALINANGKIVIDYGMYNEIAFCENEYLRVLKNNKYGYLDAQLKQVIAIDYDSASDFENGLTIVQKKGCSNLITEKNKTVYASKDYQINSTSKLFSIKSNFYIVSNNTNLLGLINNKGQSLLPIIYSKIEPLNNALFLCEKQSETFLFNSNTKTTHKINN